MEDDTSPDILQVEKDVQERQLDRLADVKAERDDDAVEAALEDLRESVEAGGNVIPEVVAAVKTYATMGEIMGVFEDAHGAYRETVGMA